MSSFLVACLLAIWLVPSGALASEERPGGFDDLASVAAFDELMQTVNQLRNAILEDATNDREAAEGMRFILRTLAMSQDVTGDGYPAAPHFARMDTARRKVGGDNPDGSAVADGERGELIWYDSRTVS